MDCFGFALMSNNSYWKNYNVLIIAVPKDVKISSWSVDPFERGSRINKIWRNMQETWNGWSVMQESKWRNNYQLKNLLPIIIDKVTIKWNLSPFWNRFSAPVVYIIFKLFLHHIIHQFYDFRSQNALHTPLVYTSNC